MWVENVIRIILIILIATSFVPQYRRILSCRHVVGISPIYILINLIVATEHITWVILQFGIGGLPSAIPVHRPIELSDWLNVTHFAIIFAGHLSLFCAYLFYSPWHKISNVVILFIYKDFLLISLLPVIALAVYLVIYPDLDPFALVMPIMGQMGVCLVTTILGFTTYFPQARELRARSDSGALSKKWLAIQSAVFLGIAIYWLMYTGFKWSFNYTFYNLILTNAYYWPVLDNLVYACTQASLWWCSRHCVKEDIVITGETAPLLGA